MWIKSEVMTHSTLTIIEHNNIIINATLVLHTQLPATVVCQLLMQGENNIA